MSQTDREPCYFCGDEKTSKYCSVCKKWMCDDCRPLYPMRLKAMIKEGVKKVLG